MTSDHSISLDIARALDYRVVRHYLRQSESKDGIAIS